jgi:hypothetical protein
MTPARAAGAGAAEATLRGASCTRAGRTGTAATRGGSTRTCRSVTCPPPEDGQLSKPKVPGITARGTTSAATSTIASGTLAMKALAIRISVEISAALAKALRPGQMSYFR